MFGQNSKENTVSTDGDEIEEKDKAISEPKEKGKVVWLKLDGESEIELFDTPNLAKKAEELGWTKKDNK